MSENPLFKAVAALKADLLKQRELVATDEHHLEFVGELNGAGYVNDSKSIRLFETLETLKQMKGSVILITGGADDGNDYSVLSEQVKEKVNTIIYLGENSDCILKHYATYTMLFMKASSVEESVKMAYLFAQSTSIVLFSPGCNHSLGYKARGNKFKEEVKNLLLIEKKQ